MKVVCGRCPDCQCLIWSRCLKDSHFCDCSGLIVTGGPDNPIFSGEYADNKHTVFASVEIDDVSDEDLYNDWKSGGKEYGWLYTVEDTE